MMKTAECVISDKRALQTPNSKDNIIRIRNVIIQERFLLDYYSILLLLEYNSILQGLTIAGYKYRIRNWVCEQCTCKKCTKLIN